MVWVASRQTLRHFMLVFNGEQFSMVGNGNPESSVG